ncbi:hypothetical protein MUK42_03759 [Musa troglodytarum]|uniref:Uncharacterized protein n=1 Tax=Musa troglodytarum TaxID=320322 RepID=A0A9E7EZH0_9LILI|nr:hypothetical protein MUK42_03759 [Musa troglodytarum]
MGKRNWRLEEEEEGPSAGGDRLGQSGSGIAITLMGKEDGIKGYWNGNLPQILFTCVFSGRFQRGGTAHLFIDAD